MASTSPRQPPDMTPGQPPGPASRNQTSPSAPPPPPQAPESTSPVSPTPDREKPPTQPKSHTTTADHELPLHAGDLPLASKSRPQLRARVRVRVQPAGESGRSGVHPRAFVRITLRSASWASRAVNVLWPVVPAAVAVRYAAPAHHLAVFVLSYLAMVPCANLVGFAGQELSRKFPHVIGVLIETT